MLGGRPPDGIIRATLPGAVHGQEREVVHMHATIMGLDIAKTVLQVCGAIFRGAVFP